MYGEIFLFTNHFPFSNYPNFFVSTPNKLIPFANSSFFVMTLYMGEYTLDSMQWNQSFTCNTQAHCYKNQIQVLVLWFCVPSHIICIESYTNNVFWCNSYNITHLQVYFNFILFCTLYQLTLSFFFLPIISICFAISLNSYSSDNLFSPVH